MKLHPIDCCTYPILVDDKNIEQSCNQRCQSEPSKPYCNRVCFLKELDIYADKKVKIDNLKNLFTLGQGNTPGNVGDKWKDIMEESTKTCLTEHEVADEIAEADVSMVIFNLMICIRRHNFVGCPDMVDKAECADMKDAIKTCDKSSESMLFGVFHEERKADQLKGGTAIQGGGQHGMGR